MTPMKSQNFINKATGGGPGKDDEEEDEKKEGSEPEIPNLYLSEIGTGLELTGYGLDSYTGYNRLQARLFI